MNCKNCDNLTSGKFCANCGQNTKVDKLNLPNFLTEISDSVFQLNRGLFYTIKELFNRPGHAIRGFIQGRRKEYFKPIAYVLTLSTIYFIISQLSDHPTLIDDFLAGYSNGGEERGLETNSSPILNWLSDNYAYTTLLLLPLFSFATYLSFNGLGQNYLEHIVINSYITGQQAIIYSFLMIIGVLINREDITILAAVIICTMFNYWTFSQFYSNTKGFKIIFRLLLAYILYVVFVSIFLIAFTFKSLAL
ncbi:Protein of unknown function [Maribacter sedimenticola]|uniref:DUF3667 domain-containing protein n=1 Tax=Maribacter sedimenticola TaxID=228956 RepID=A0ABY1SHI7_9FLAO|nr:DUF3667 domain-containing protein [Maribacter sedimenticola]SNR54107.1 Protein of unknown function [Maribacter sedimenticola]